MRISDWSSDVCSSDLSAQAESWYRRAAEQGLPMGQYNLGILYGTGTPDSRDTVQAYAWLTLAEVQGLDLAAPARAAIAQHMTAAERAAAEGLARRWQEEIGRAHD